MTRSSPKRGEVWIAQLDPTRGGEMQKTRPVVIISSDSVGALPVRLAAPCTTSELCEALWRVPIKAGADNRLDRDTTVDLMQTRALSVERLVRCLGRLTEAEMTEVAAAMAIVVDYE